MGRRDFLRDHSGIARHHEGSGDAGSISAGKRRFGVAALALGALLWTATGRAADPAPAPDCSGGCEPARFLLAGETAIDVELISTHGGCAGVERRAPAFSFRLDPEAPDVTIQIPRGEPGSWRALAGSGRATECALFTATPSAAGDSIRHAFRFLRSRPTGSIAGAVVDLGSRLRPDVDVELRPVEIPPCEAARICTTLRAPAPVPRVDRTDESGAFRFDDLPTGEYLISLPGKEPPERGRLFVAPGANFQLGEVPHDLLGSIDGTIVIEVGGSVDDVVFYPADPDRASPEPAVVSEGRFRIDALPSGRWLVFGRREGIVVVGKRATVLPARLTTIELDEPVEVLSGTLTSDGVPAEGQVCLNDRFGAATRCVSTESTGPWSIPVLARERNRTAFVRLHEPAGRFAARPVPSLAAGADGAWALDVPAAELLLRLSWADGMPVESGRVWLEKDGVRSGRPHSVQPGGFVSIPGPLSPGRWGAVYEEPGIQRPIELPAHVERGGLVEATFDLALGRPMRLVDIDGFSIAGATLAIRDPRGEWLLLPADSEGIARVTGRREAVELPWILRTGHGPARARRISGSLDAGIETFVADELPSHDLAFEFKSTGGDPIPALTLDLASSSLPPSLLREQLRLQNVASATDAHGRLLFPSLPEGDWTVAATAFAGQANEIRFAPSTVELPRSSAFAFELDLAPSR